ncbi:MAG TPA: acyl transferase [Chitinophagales bacterium]|nr:acyl transferase [Chitinophagales bacterium]HMW11572.1 acyl transferase [Chitinophagales bacterium]HMX60885.1 acyl transferase [Chitinophagales bacterium]HMY24004.1 acyl transferase [Chitinophagales bacterium]HMZ32607.1 acyl transferase [Chitinophagales bacterium]
MFPTIAKLQEKIFTVDDLNFEKVALEIFHFQYTHNLVYKQFVDYLKTDINAIDSIEKIPFLPIDFFKSHTILINNATSQKLFESSGTTGMLNSKHYVADLRLYEQSFEKGFQQYYGNIEDWIILALLPSYLERDTSSLVYMVNALIQKSKNKDAGFYLNNLDELAAKLTQLSSNSYKKILLIGVTFALLDFAEQFPMDLSNISIMETGGMKGRRKEMTREEVHQQLQAAFQVPTIHSEYGMTELLSQAYSFGNSIFQTPNWMRVLKRDIYNPMQVSSNKGRGALNVIDLANIYSCAFIATQDIVNIRDNGYFEVLGRIDNSDIRGCNLMVS